MKNAKPYIPFDGDVQKPRRPWFCVECRKPNDPQDSVCDTLGCMGLRAESRTTVD